MRKLLRFLKDYKAETVLGPFFKLLEACFELVIPLVVASVIDIGIENGDRSYILSRCLIMVALGIVGLICAITAQFFAAKAATGFSSKLRSSLFDHIMKLSASKKDTLGSSTLITRMTSDINQIQSGLNLVLRLFLRSPFIVIGAMVMAFTVDAHSALIFVITIPILSVVVFGIMLISIPMYRKVQAKLDRVMLATRENLNGTKVIRAFNKEKAEIEAFKVDNESNMRLQITAGHISALMNPLTYVIINFAIIILIDKGALRVDGGIITQGQLFALVSYMSQILTELIKLANLIINITKSIASGNRVQAVFDVPEGVIVTDDFNATDDKGAYIEFKNITMTYAGASAPTLNGIDFTVSKGEIVGVIGATGSGKTTLINLLPRLYDVSDGSIIIDGKDIRSIPLEELRSKFALVPQKAVLFKGTIRDNLLWGNKNATDDDMWEALRQAMAYDFVCKKDGQLDAEVLSYGNNFSGGQKQRLTIARSLIRHPEILILDDSTSALDLATDASLRNELSRLSYKPTIFIVSQRASSVRHADKIIVLEDGEAVGIGTHSELISNCPTYIEIYRSQFGDRDECITQAFTQDSTNDGGDKK